MEIAMRLAFVFLLLNIVCAKDDPVATTTLDQSQSDKIIKENTDAPTTNQPTTNEPSTKNPATVTNEASTTQDNATTTENSTIEFFSTNPTISNNETMENITLVNSTIFTTDAESTTIELETTTSSAPSGCENSLCMNGGTCTDKSDDDGFECHCVHPYVGLRCETYDLCDVSTSGKQCENGACVYSKGIRSCQCFFGDYWDELNKVCKEVEPPCFPNPCLNGGTCMPSLESYTCKCDPKYVGHNCEIRNTCGKDNTCKNGDCVLDDTETYKYCKCFQNYHWNNTAKECQPSIPPCLPNPCKHGGKCTSISSESFNCSCVSSFVGPTCETKDYCFENEEGEICEHGKCTASNTTNSQYCACPEGYHLDVNLRKCTENILPCHSNPCKNDAACVSLSSDEYKCICTTGYEGKDCSLANRCELEGGAAFCGAANCSMNYSWGSYSCVCGEDEYFDYKFRQCNDLDLCPLMECEKNEICANSVCICKDNFVLDNDTGECRPDYCSSKPCPSPDMFCEENIDGDAKDFYCYCKKGYAFNGTHCNPAFCAFPEFNNCDQTCTIKKNSFVCGCDPSFKLQADSKTCKPIKPEVCINTTCTGGTCVKKDREICLCHPGYHPAINGTCIDDCTSKKFPIGYCPGTCETSKDVGYRCKCEGKFILSKDKVTCTRRRMCSENEIGWTACKALKANCVDDWKSKMGYRCECSLGQEKSKEGICLDICDTDESRLECSILGATCGVDSNGVKFCKCPPYFQTSEVTNLCDRPAKFSYSVNLPLGLDRYVKTNIIETRKKRSFDNEDALHYQLIWSDITDSLYQLYEGFQRANVLICRKYSDYIGCKIEVQFQVDNLNDLSRLKVPSVCKMNDTISSNTCVLPPSLVLRSDKLLSEVNFKSSDPCDFEIKEDLCGSETTCSSSLEKKTFNCTCNAGFTARRKEYPFGDPNSVIESCRDVDECEEDNACPSSTKCFNTLGSYLCLCLDGYRLKHELSDPKEDGCVELCKPSPCVHGPCVAKGKHSFECRCDIGYKGLLCDMLDKNYKRAHTNSIIVGVVLGGILLLTVILFVAYISRLKKKKILEDPNQIFYGASEMASSF